jgi:hypothetical protein
MGAPLRRIERITHFTSSGWHRDPDNSLIETCDITAHFSDGRTMTRAATITYAPGQRERLMESVLTNIMAPRDHAFADWVRTQRWRRSEQVYGSFHSEFGKGANFA